MNRYEKPNAALPISLHDANITAVRAVPASSGDIDGKITLEFAEGYCKVDEREARQTGRAEILFSGIDFDFSHVYLCTKCMRREISFPELAEYVEKNSLEVIDETYGCNQSKFSCVLYIKSRWYDVEIEIYHFHETVYQWEEKPV